MKNISLIILSIFACSVIYSQSVHVEIDKIVSKDGVIRIAIYQNQNQLDKDKAYKLLTYSKKSMVNGKMSMYITLPSGSYGMAILDDTNANAKMDYNLIGVPKEGYAFSNYYHSGFSYPDLNEFSFESNNEIKVYCKMKYF
jgi:uncharacterized protein (DUF2141 family)